MSLDFTIKLEDFVPEAKGELKQAIERSLYAMGVKAVEGSVEAISGNFGIEKAVKTGRLRASISFITPSQSGGSKAQPPKNAKAGDKLNGKAPDNSVIVGTNVEYAEKVHNGMWTSEKGGEERKYKERPFIREGIDQTKDEMKEQVTRIFKGEL